uniref:G protein-coupled receptor n=1 Tax=Caenorhabditis japonica TaxID=281687 RepID=A0A8R1DFT2_CAEJA
MSQHYNYTRNFYLFTMTGSLEISQFVELLGSLLSLVSNVFLLVLIHRFSHPEYGSYKILMILMAGLYVVYSAIEVLVMPSYFVFEYNYLLFTTNYINYQAISQYLIITFCATFGAMQMVLAFQFIFRYMSVACSPISRHMFFEGRRHFLWIGATFLYFSNWFIMAILFFKNSGNHNHPKELAVAVEERFGRNISQMAGTLVTYAVMGIIWATLGQLMGSPWTADGQLLGNSWAALGQQMGSSWTADGQLLGIRCAALGQLMGSSWASDRQQMGSRWADPEQQTGRSWAADGQFPQIDDFFYFYFTYFRNYVNENGKVTPNYLHIYLMLYLIACAAVPMTISSICAVKTWHAIRITANMMQKSYRIQKQERQLFFALLIQFSVPFLGNTVPMMLLFLCPALHISTEPYTNYICMAVPFYPLFDAWCTIFIIKDYYRGALKLLGLSQHVKCYSLSGSGTGTAKENRACTVNGGPQNALYSSQSSSQRI